MRTLLLGAEIGVEVDLGSLSLNRRIVRELAFVASPANTGFEELAENRLGIDSCTTRAIDTELRERVRVACCVRV